MFGLAFFGFTALLFDAITQIWMRSSTGNVCGCESRGVVAEEEDEMVKWQRWESGGRWCCYKALSPPFRPKGFWETVPAICAAPNSLTRLNGPLPGFSRNHSPCSSFIATVSCYSSSKHRLLCHLTMLSNYYCIAVPLILSPWFDFSDIFALASGTGCLLGWFSLFLCF